MYSCTSHNLTDSNLLVILFHIDGRRCSMFPFCCCQLARPGCLLHGTLRASMRGCGKERPRDARFQHPANLVIANP